MFGLKKKRKPHLVTLASFALCLIGAFMFLSIAEPAFAKDGGGGGMPWESANILQHKSYTYMNDLKWQQ